MSVLLCLGRTVEWAPWSACSLAKDPNQASYKLPCQTGLPNLPLQMDRTTGCSLCSGTTVSRNVVPQDLSPGCCEPIPFSVSSVSQWLTSTDFPSDPCEGRPKWTFWEAPYSARGAEFLLWVPSSPLSPTPPKSYRPRGHLMWPCNYPEMGNAVGV